MKSMTRQQLADRAGVDVRTLNHWLEPHRPLLYSMGMPQGKGTLPPNIVRWISDRFCIEVSP